LAAGEGDVGFVEDNVCFGFGEGHFFLVPRRNLRPCAVFSKLL
jgi:hypothetical protein